MNASPPLPKQQLGSQHWSSSSIFSVMMVGVGLLMCNSRSLNVVMAASSPATGRDYQNISCSSVEWNVTDYLNLTTMNYTCSYQALGSTKTIVTNHYCVDVLSDSPNCTCVQATLNGKACNTCSVCGGRQAAVLEPQQLLVQTLVLDCNSNVSSNNNVCETQCNNGWTGCGGTAATNSPTTLSTPKPTAAPKTSAAATPAAHDLRAPRFFSTTALLSLATSMLAVVMPFLV